MTDPKIYTAGLTIETNVDKSIAASLLRSNGTLGGFGRDASGQPVLISCSHVLFPGFKALSDTRVYSPGYSSTCCGGDPIARPVFDVAKQASDEGVVEGWVGGYHAGTWTGGFNWVAARVNVNGHNVAGHASELDCAAARLDPGVRFSNAWHVEHQDGSVTTIPLKGAVTESLGIGKGPDFGTAPTEQQYVRLYSADGKILHYGTMISTRLGLRDVPFPGDPDNLLYRFGIGDLTDALQGTKASVNQFLILPRPAPVAGGSYQDGYRRGESLDFHGGESGSFVINSDNLVIAMLIRIVPPTQLGLDTSLLEVRDVKNLGIATPIGPILANLNVTIPSDPDGWSGTVPASGPRTARVVGADLDAQTARRRQAVAQLRGELHTSVRGRLLLGKIGQHHREVRRLMTTVRPIAVTWRALAGPAYLAACLRSLENPGYRIPASINGVPRERLLAAMAALFGKYGSDPLRRDIERYEGLLTGALLPLTALNEVPAALARPGARS
jgi:hypothetical protein